MRGTFNYVQKELKWVSTKNWHSNKTIQSEELEIINVTTICNKKADKNKETLSTYCIKVKEKTFSMSVNKEKYCGGYVRMCIHQTLITFNVWTRIGSTWDDRQSDERDCGDIQLWYK